MATSGSCSRLHPAVAVPRPESELSGRHPDSEARGARPSALLTFGVRRFIPKTANVSAKSSSRWVPPDDGQMAIMALEISPRAMCSKGRFASGSARNSVQAVSRLNG